MEPTPGILSWIGNRVARAQHLFLDTFRTGSPLAPGSKELAEIVAKSRVRTDISDHLVPMFYEALAARPRLIVELGVRGGVSTFVLERVARLLGKLPLVSVDIDDCSRISDYGNWHFVKQDDVAFAKEFVPWCRSRDLPSEIDFLFIDTSHLYEHTLQEIRSWFPLLSNRATVCFHDTNQKRIYWRKDGSIGLGWDNNRGVISAIEEHFGTRFDETVDFVDLRKGWIIKHTAACSGFTTLIRVTT
jgi:cephalosporin hydroxylase